MATVLTIFFLLLIYYGFGYIFGYSAYKDWFETRTSKYEKDITPKSLRNIIRLITFTFWPICAVLLTIYLIYHLLIFCLKDFYNFWFK